MSYLNNQTHRASQLLGLALAAPVLACLFSVTSYSGTRSRFSGVAKTNGITSSLTQPQTSALKADGTKLADVQLLESTKQAFATEFVQRVVSTGFAATVTNTNDSGPGSLRDAIAATPVGGTVNFALSGCPCTITLTTGDLAITKDLTVIGPGADQLTISGNNAWRPLRIGEPYVIPGPGPQIITVVIDGLTLTNGVAGPWPSFSGLDNHGGGIIAVDTYLTVRNSIISNNIASQNGGGIATVVSSTTILNSTISGNTAGSGFPRGNGGGIFNGEGDLVVERSSISNNRAVALGGGIYTNWYHTSQVRNSSISGNTAFRASGILVSGYTTAEIVNTTIEGNTSINDAAINNQIATINIVNSTISGNIAGPGSGGLTGYGCAGIVNLNYNPGYPDEPINATVTITNTTITGNHGVVTEIASVGGIYTEAQPNEPDYPATTIVRNSIVAGNTPGPEVVRLGLGAFQSSGYNLIGNAGLITVFNQPGDQAGTPSAPLNPGLEALAFNGGPTKTHALRFDSPALDRGFGFGSVTDQRGLRRPNDDPNIPNAAGGDGSDIGAFESSQLGPNPIDSLEFFVRQHYLDFLNREPDPPGLAGWLNVLNDCAPGDTSCDRVHVSAAFFQSPEFQERGYFVYRFYSASFGRKPDFTEFTPDLARVSGFLNDDQLEAAKVAFVNDFVSRPGFAAMYNSLNNVAYVDALINAAGVNLSNRQALIDALNNGTATRAQVLRQIVESSEVYQKYYNQAFVVMEYFGYLRRDPDALYLNWIAVLDQTNDPRGMVTGFATSTEYRQRFGQ